MISDLKLFFKKRPTADRLVLALSGGPDSMALYHMLLEAEIPFAVAHVNHNWRAESSLEAEWLKNYVTVPFHLHELNPEASLTNREEVCRKERLTFFRQLMVEHGYHAVLMGHHADDQAETVLKRLFEGAKLSLLGAIRREATVEGVRILRPLLNVPKNLLIEYCKEREIPFFEDNTNSDPRYLRSRMRGSIIPKLSALFGKEISQPLERVAQDALELEAYLDHKVASILEFAQVGPFGWMVNIPIETPALEIKHLLGKLSLSRQQIESAVGFILAGKANKQVGPLFIDRRRIFLPNTLSLPQEPLPLEPGSHSWGPYEVTVKETHKKDKNSSWKEFWQGKIVHTVPYKKMMLIQPSNKEYPGNSPISHWWNKHKVPVYLRNQVPVIQIDEYITHEFLTGRSIANEAGEARWLSITLDATGCVDITDLIREKYNVTVEGETVMC